MTPKLDMIGLVVEDMAASLAFYRRLGLDIPETEDSHVEVALPNGLRFGWDTVATIRSFMPEWTKPKGGNAVGMAFLCDSPAEVDKLHADLIAAGYRSHKDPWDAFWGQRYACVMDPDDNVVDLFAPLT
jgi:catechol 2,3-dioxygenase-like lactoylglutathione lyase family enzyme